MQQGKVDLNNISFHSIPKDEWEMGESVECQECGREVRHYVLIGTTAFGRDCAATILGYSSTKKMETHLEPILEMAEYHWLRLERFVDEQRQRHSDYWGDWSESGGEYYCSIINLAMEHNVEEQPQLCHKGYLAARLYDIRHGTTYGAI